MKLKTLFAEAKKVLKSEGWRTLIRVVFRYFMDLIKPEYRNVYLIEADMANIPELDFTLEFLDEINVHVAHTEQQLYSLLAEGYDMTSTPMVIDSLKKRISKGAIAHLIFVRHELAHWYFTAMNETAKDAIEPYPYKVDFTNNEACAGNAQTAMKFRGKGLMSYGTVLRLKFFRENGIVRSKGTIGVSNLSSLRANVKTNPKVRGKGRYIRILWWKFWKETPLVQPVPLRELVSALKVK